MDERIERHAELLATYCTDVKPGDDVLIFAPPVAEDLVVALFEQVGNRGGRPLFQARSSRARRAYLHAVEPGHVETAVHERAAVEAADVVVAVRATTNAYRTNDVDTDTATAFADARRPIRDAAQRNRGVATQYPTAADAQRAGMATAEFREFVWDAVTLDWDAQRRRQRRVARRLEEADRVRIVSEPGTDVSMRVGPMRVQSEDGTENLPGGEVFTAPVVDSVEGTVHFDVPVRRRGREMEDVTLTFEGGRVTEYSASTNEEVLGDLLDTDEGARRVGELGIGLNPAIDRVTYNTLFDEKIDGTVHLALGDAYESTVPEEFERNKSAIHVDMITDVSESSRIVADGETIQRNGVFLDGETYP